MQLLRIICIVWLTCPVRTRAKYGTFCNRSDVCDDAAPFCNIYFVDSSYAKNRKSDISILPSADLAPRRYGVCVQCLDDCDCDVNQYCGTDPYDPIKIPPFVSENTGTGSNIFIKKRIQMVSASLSNIAIQSKCMDYVRPLSRCYSDSTEVTSGSELVPESDVHSPARMINRLRTPAGWPKAAQSEFCGKITSFAPAFYTIVASGNQADSVLESEGFKKPSSSLLSTSNFFNSPAVCPPWTIFKDDAITCKSCLYGDNCEYSSLRQEYCCSHPSSFDSQNRRCSTYRSCRGACSSQMGTTATSDINCALIMPASKYLTPVEVATFCACVTRCETCVASNGGCGSQRPNSLLPSSVWGTCSGSCPSEPVVSGHDAQIYPCSRSGATVWATNQTGKIQFQSYTIADCRWIIAPAGAGAVSLNVQKAQFSQGSYVMVQSCYDSICSVTNTIVVLDSRTPDSFKLPLTLSSSSGIMLLSFQSYAQYQSNSFTIDFAAAAGGTNRISTCQSGLQSSAQQSPAPPDDIVTCQPKCLTCLAEAAGCTCPDAVPTFNFTPTCSNNGHSDHFVNDNFSTHAASYPIEWSGYCERGTCKVCRDGDRRCSSGSRGSWVCPHYLYFGYSFCFFSNRNGHGIQQICRNGAWTRDQVGTEDLYRSLGPPLYAAASFSGLTFCCLAVLGCWILAQLKLKKVGPPRLAPFVRVTDVRRQC
jgi:hypothetical protein